MQHLATALHARKLHDPMDAAVTRRDFLPPEDFDLDLPGVAELRQRQHEALDRQDAATAALEEATSTLAQIERDRARAAEAGEPLPSTRDAEDTLTDARLSHDAVSRQVADELADFAAEVRAKLGHWSLDRPRAEVQEKRRKAEELLREAEEDVALVESFDLWAEQFGRPCGSSGWWRPFADVVLGKTEVKAALERAQVERHAAEARAFGGGSVSMAKNG